MYFEATKTIKISKMINNSEDILAHIDGNRIEKLSEHMNLTINYLYKLIINKNLDTIFKKIEGYLIPNFSVNGVSLYKEILLNTIYLHDMGKINCGFQTKKMNNILFRYYEGNKFNYSNHSMLSAIIYINHYFIKIKEHNAPTERNKLFTLLILNSYIISKHHGKLDSIDSYLNKLIELDGEGYKILEDRISIFDKTYKEKLIINHKIIQILVNGTKQVLKYNNKSIVYYIYLRFLSSLLLTCDYYATSEFINNKTMAMNGNIDSIDIFYDEFKKTNIYELIRKYEIEEYKEKKDFKNIKDINILRNEIFLEAEKVLLENRGKDIFYLEAPTGSGKSNVAFNLSFKMLEIDKDLNKIFYVYPFNTLIEQNINTLRNIFRDEDVMKDIAIINSVTPIKHDKRERVDFEEISDVSDENYEQSLLNRQFLQYPIVLTTHVSLFNFLFGVTKGDLFPLAQLANSVVILDEIQSYKNKIWKEIITFLNYYSSILNIKIIIMSATLPDLNELFNGKLNSVKLIKNREKYYNNKIFKNRVMPDFSLLKSNETKSDLFNHIIKTVSENKGNILIEFLTKTSAVDFYNILKNTEELDGSDIQLITGDDNRVERNRIIRKVKNDKDRRIILVATQVIEAGVDIDMDIGYKNVSMLDAEEQFIGRINRSSNKKTSIVYFFNLDNAGGIYKGDVRKEKNINIENEEFQEIFKNKRFKDFYSYVFAYLEKEAKKENDNSYNNFIESEVKNLEFDNIKERMNLIDSMYEYSIFLNINLVIEEDEVLIGEEVWNEYKEILANNNLEYAEKKIRLSEITSKMSYFIYKVNNNDFIYNEQIGDLYYIYDGEDYFNEGKFDRGIFNKGGVDFI